MTYAITLNCSSKTIAHDIGLDLGMNRILPDPKADYYLVIDKPTGYALIADIPKHQKIIVATDNHCPEYVLDLYARGVSIVVPLSPQLYLGKTIFNILTGDYGQAAVTLSTLTPCERLTLQGVARGMDNKQIAKLSDVTEGVVKNRLTQIYDKLQLGSRYEIIHYYLGNSHLLFKCKSELVITQQSDAVVLEDFDALFKLVA